MRASPKRFSWSAGMCMTGKPKYSVAEPDGATTKTLWPCDFKCSSNLSTELVTPFTCGRNDSVTMQTLTEVNSEPET